MKAAFALLLVALLILPAVLTARIMVSRERRRLDAERAAASPDSDRG